MAPAHEIECAERCIQRLRQHDRDCGDGRGGIAGVDIEPWQHECCCKYRRIRARGEFLRPHARTERVAGESDADLRLRTQTVLGARRRTCSGRAGNRAMRIRRHVVGRGDVRLW